MRRQFRIVVTNRPGRPKPDAGPVASLSTRLLTLAALALAIFLATAVVLASVVIGSVLVAVVVVLACGVILFALVRALFLRSGSRPEA